MRPFAAAVREDVVAVAPGILQRIREARPQAVFFFFPSGVMPPAFLKAWKERGMEQAGIRLFATGEATDDTYLQATGDVALGLVTSHHYSWAHPAARNRQFVRNFEAEAGTGLRPNYFAVTAYDGMSALAAALEKTRGDTSGEALVTALQGQDRIEQRCRNMARAVRQFALLPPGTSLSVHDEIWSGLVLDELRLPALSGSAPRPHEPHGDIEFF